MPFSFINQKIKFETSEYIMPLVGDLMESIVLY